MRKNVLMAILMMAGMTAYAADDNVQQRLQQLKANGADLRMPVVHNNGKAKQPTVLSVPGAESAFKPWSAMPSIPTGKKAAVALPTPSTLSANAYGTLMGPEGKLWFYKEDFTFANTYYYSGATITVYDEMHVQKGVITVDVSDKERVNMIEPFGYLTKKFFDKKQGTIELMVNIHCAGNADNNYQGSYDTQVYSLNGAFVANYPYACVMVDATVRSWEPVQRLLCPQDVAVTEDSTVIRVDVMVPPTIKTDTPSVVHTFEIPAILTTYLEGSYLNTYAINDEIHYVISHYAKPFVKGYDMSTGEMIVEDNNSLVIKTYNNGFEMVDSLAVPIVKGDDALYRFASFGILTDYDLSKDFFSHTGKFDYIVGFSDYITSLDDFLSEYNVYDNQGNLSLPICDKVSSVIELSPLLNKNDEIGFLQNIGDDQQIQMVAFPSCQKTTCFPSTIDGEQVSTQFNRLHGDNPQGHTYLMALGSAKTATDGGVLARMAWITPEARIDSFSYFNMGKGVENFTPHMASQAMDPYLFDTDETMEIIYIKAVTVEGSSKKKNVLCINKCSGEEVMEYHTDSIKGALHTVVLLTDNVENKELMIINYNQSEGIYNVEFYPLPLTRFSKGGKGTKNDPYLIATAGDLQQIGKAGEGYYSIVNDLNLSTMNKSWEPIRNFKGTLYGNNHTLNKMYIDNVHTASVGLFSDLDLGCRIQDLTINGALIILSTGNSCAGMLAGTATTDTISNVVVNNSAIADAETNGTINAKIGGIVGQAALYSVIEGSMVYNTGLDAGNSVSMGGIAGDIRTSSSISACEANTMKIRGTSSLGGIVGTTGNGTPVTNCKASTTLIGNQTIGGIVGESFSRAPITNCIATGIIVSTAEASATNYNMGGIVGYLASNWANSSAKVVRGNVADVNILLPEGVEQNATTNRIAGWTIANEEYSASEKHYTDEGLAQNYATSTYAIAIDQSTASDTTVNGANLEQKDQAFFESIGFKYGTTVNEPWRDLSAQSIDLPALYIYDNVTTGIETIAAQQASRPEAVLKEGVLSVKDANRIVLYSLNGMMVGNTQGSKMQVGNLQSGAYMMVVTMPDGTISSMKFMKQ
ncbi:MAG: hypothetical protein ACI4BA_02995 [Prevotella sp.]